MLLALSKFISMDPPTRSKRSWWSHEPNRAGCDHTDPALDA